MDKEKEIQEVLRERERCKTIVQTRIEAIIRYREENIRHKYKRNISMLERLEKHLLFLIENPDYVRQIGLSNISGATILTTKSF